MGESCVWNTSAWGEEFFFCWSEYELHLYFRGLKY